MAVTDRWHFAGATAEAKARKAGITSTCAKPCPCRGRQWPTKDNPGQPTSKLSWDSARWQARPPGRPARSFVNKADAEIYERAARDERQQAKLGAKQFDHSRGDITLKDYVDLWLPTRDFSPRTVEIRRVHFGRHIVPYMGHLRLNQIELSTVEGFFAHLRKTKGVYTKKLLGPSYIMGVYITLGMLFKSAIADRRLQMHPFTGFPEPTVPPRGRAQIWEDEVVDAMLAALSGQDETIAQLAIACGHRINEALAVSRRAVRSLRREIVIDHQLYYVDGALKLVPCKHNGSRVVGLPQDMVERLAAHMASHPTVSVRCTCHGTEHDLIFSHRGRPIVSSPWNKRVWHPALAQAAQALKGSPLLEGISLNPDDEDRTGFHMLRHYCASLWIAGDPDAGVPGATILEVAQWLGHKGTRYVDGCYGHLFRRSENRARAIMDAAANARQQRRAAAQARQEASGG